MDNRFYGYKHWTLEEAPRCFYVGKGVANRPGSQRGRNHKWRAVTKRLGLRVEVCIGPVTDAEACAWEIEQITQEGTFSQCHDHDSDDIGCNFTRGGEGVAGCVWSQSRRERVSVCLKDRPKPQRSAEHCQRLALANTGRKDTLDVRKRKSDSQKARFQDPSEREKHHAACNSPSAKVNQSAAAKSHSPESRERTAAKLRKPIKQYDAAGALIATFSSAAEAARAVNGSQGNISRAARKQYMMSSGFFWRYVVM